MAEANRRGGGAGGPKGGSSDGPEMPGGFPGYQIEFELGEGGMGKVYRAKELSTKRTVALKVMLAGRHASERQRRRFEREVEIAASLEHPNVARLYASGIHEGRYWFAMEYVEGERLDHYAAGRKLGIPEVLSLFAKVCEGVNHAHQRGVLHRDLKPGNILVDGAGEPRVLDFGLAKLVDRPPGAEESLSLAGEVAGTPAYMSPEQARGETTRLDIRSDVYSLGVILYRLLAGRPPYGKEGSLPETLRAIVEVDPPSPRRLRKEIPDEVSSIVLKAMEKDPQRRYQSAGELGKDLSAHLSGDPVSAKGASGWYMLRKTARRHWRLAAAVGAVVVLSLGLGTTMSALYTKTRIELRDVVREREVLREKVVYLDREVAAVKPEAASQPAAAKAPTTLPADTPAAPFEYRQVATLPEAYDKLTLDPAGDHYGYSILAEGGKMAMVVDGKAGPAYEAVGPLAFSDSGSRWAYAARKGDKWLAVIDGQPEKEYEEVYPSIAFSPDGRRVAFTARIPAPQSRPTTTPASRPSQAGQWLVVADGREVATTGELLSSPIFSPDGSRWAALAGRADGTRFLVVDGKAEPDRGSVLDFPAFSQDGKHMAYPVSRNGKAAVVSDGQAGREFGQVGRVFLSADGARLAYWASSGSFWFLVLDGNPGSVRSGVGGAVASREVVFSGDGKHVAYPSPAADGAGKWSAMLDGQPGPAYEDIGVMRFSPAGRLAYWAKSMGSWLLMVDGLACPGYDATLEDSLEMQSELAFGANTGPLAYLRGDGGKWRVAVGGDRSTGHDLIRHLRYRPGGALEGWSVRGDILSRLTLKPDAPSAAATQPADEMSSPAWWLEKASREIDKVAPPARKASPCLQMAIVAGSVGDSLSAQQWLQAGRGILVQTGRQDALLWQAYALLVAAQRKAGDSRGAALTVQEAWRLAGGTTNPYERVVTLQTLATQLAVADLIAEAKGVAEAIPDGYEKASAYADISLEEARTGDSLGARRTAQRAVAIADRMPNIGLRNKTLSNIGAVMAWMGDFAGAETMAARMVATEDSPEASFKPGLETSMVRALARAGQYAKAKAIVDRCYPEYRTYPYRGLAEWQFRNGDKALAMQTLDEAEAFVAKMPDPSRWEYSELALASAKIGDAARVRRAAAAFPKPPRELRCRNTAYWPLRWQFVGESQAQVGDFEGARATAKLAENEGHKIGEMIEFAIVTDQLRQRDFTGAVRTAEAMAAEGPQYRKSVAMMDIAFARMKAGERAQIAAWIDSLPDPGHRAFACVGAARFFMPPVKPSVRW